MEEDITWNTESYCDFALTLIQKQSRIRDKGMRKKKVKESKKNLQERRQEKIFKSSKSGTMKIWITIDQNGQRTKRQD